MQIKTKTFVGQFTETNGADDNFVAAVLSIEGCTAFGS